MHLSLSEIFMAIILMILFLKPEDFKKILGNIQSLRKYWGNFNKELKQDFVEDDIEIMNFYLSKMISQGIEYNGTYNVEEIKSYYYKYCLPTNLGSDLK